MRITNRNQMHSYLNRMNNNLNKLTKSNDKMASQRSFNKSWENVSDATRTMRVRRMLRANDHSLTNIRDAQGRMNAAEDNLKAINNILENTLDRDLQGLNGTYDAADRQKIAAEIDNLQKQVLSLMNGQYADEYLFGAAGGKVSAPPFQNDTVNTTVIEFGNLWETDANGKAVLVDDGTGNMMPKYIQKLDAGGLPAVDPDGNPIYETGWRAKTTAVKDPATGKIIDYVPVKTEKGLTYNGMPVETMKQDPDTGKIMRPKASATYAADSVLNPSALPYEVDVNGDIVWEEIPFNKNNFIDIGLGFKLKGSSAAPETAMQYTFSGAELFGVGVDENGDSNNIYELLGNVRDSLLYNDIDGLGRQLDKLKEGRDRLMIGITQIGTSAKFCEEMGAIIENDNLILRSTQNDLESVDLAEEAISNKDHEMAWMVTLQLGSKVLPTSLFDFMR